MSSEARTFELPPKHARFIDEQVASGSYASGSEVVEAGLRALQESDAAFDRWLREEAVPVFDAMRADPMRGLSAKVVFAQLRERQAARLKASE